ncbi:hypothetical protein BANRA_03588 [Klebsiella pneumoniae]|nr:hypothetical protein BANRA_03588 [Klebsiella pneumoniae]VDA07054.1 hypothetical protein BANRA_04150 [Klebsiella pneumoniae]
MTKNIEIKIHLLSCSMIWQSVLSKQAGKQCKICVVTAFRILSMMLIL